MNVRLSDRSIQEDNVCIINHVPQRSNLWLKLREKGKTPQKETSFSCKCFIAAPLMNFIFNFTEIITHASVLLLDVY